MTDHTPGPWKLAADQRHILADRDGKQITIADVHHHAIYRNQDQQADANARLIAAAPDMLDALTTIQHAADTEADKALDEMNPLNVIQQIADLSSNAIAKAEGRE